MTTADELERREVSIHEWVRRASGKCCANESKYRDLCRKAIAALREAEAARDAVLRYRHELLAALNDGNNVSLRADLIRAMKGGG